MKKYDASEKKNDVLAEKNVDSARKNGDLIKNNGGRTVNAKRNILYGLLQVTVSLILPFITRTVLIYCFGVDYLGLNSLFSSVLSVLSLMELGFGTAVVYSMYKPAAEGDIDQLCAYLAYYRKIYRFIGLIILTFGLILMPFLNFFIHDKELPGGLNLYICYVIFLGDSVISYLLYGYMTAIPTAFQRRDVLSKVNIGMSFIQCVIKTMLLISSKNFYFYLISIPVCTVIQNLINAYVIKRKYPELECKGNLIIEQKHDLNKKVYGLVIEKITAVSRNSIDTLCISAFVGLTVTGMYNNYYYIMSSIIAFSTMLLGSMMAGVGNSIAVENEAKNYSDMRLFDFIYSSVAGWATVCLFCLYQPFVMTWLGKKMMLDMPIVLGLCAYFYILKSGDIRWVYQEGCGLWYESRFIMIGEAAVNIVLNILLCKIFGVFGIILATVVSVFITNYFFFPRILFSLYFKNGKLKEYLLDHFLYTVTMIISVALSWLLCERVLPVNMGNHSSIEGGIGSGFSGGIGYSILCIGGRLFLCTIISALVFWGGWSRSERYKKAVGWIVKNIM